MRELRIADNADLTEDEGRFIDASILVGHQVRTAQRGDGVRVAIVWVNGTDLLRHERAHGVAADVRTGYFVVTDAGAVMNGRRFADPLDAAVAFARALGE